MPLAERSPYFPAANLRDYRIAEITGLALLIDVLPDTAPGLRVEPVAFAPSHVRALSANMDGDLRGLQIVGVVGDVRELTPEAPPGPTLYASYRQRPGQAGQFTVIVRGPDPSAITDTVRRVIREANPDVPMRMRTVAGAFDAAVGDRRFSLWLISAFSAAALVLATLGVYGLIAFTVSQRTREMGIRMALGAEPVSLVSLIVKRGAVLAGVGAAIGLVLALALTGVVKSLLFSVSAADPVVLATVTAALLIAAMTASYLPARRILRQTPGRTLRD